MSATNNPTGPKYDGFTDAERDAMKQRATELKASSRRGGGSDDVEADVLAKIAEMDQTDRVIAERLHVVIKTAAPELTSKLWYGMPAYARDGKIVCHFQPAAKFKARYATLGFSNDAHLDDGEIWPVAYAVPALTRHVEEQVTALVQRATH